MQDLPKLPDHLKVLPGPSETTDWLTCPTLWRLKQEWDVPGPWTPYIDMGKAVDLSFEALLKTPPSTLPDSILEGVKYLTAAYQPNDDWSLDALTSLLSKSITKASETTLAQILQNETVIGTQIPLGYARPGHTTALDLLTFRDDTYIITDHKARMTMKEQKWADKEFAEIEIDWQLWDYAWRVSEMFKTQNLIIRRHLGRFSPRVRWDLGPGSPSYPQEYRINYTNLRRWATLAMKYWIEINEAREGKRTAPMNLKECLAGRYGKCKFYDFCHKCESNPDYAKAFYNKKEGGDDQ